jgi:glyoxylase-like metal-dependent hydrolase (beta-lactamase superfamily II)
MPGKYICLGLLLTALAAPVAADESKPFFTLHPLGQGVWAAVSVPGSHAGGNSGFVVGSDSVAVIDTFADANAAEALLAEIHKLTALPVRYVINTHYHLDHVAGNELFAKQGAVVLAQRNVRAWERTENLKFFGDKITAEQKLRVESLGLPTLLYREGLELYLGDRKLVLRVMPGHTGGDTVVVVPDAQVVFSGDLFWNHTLPNLIDANTVQQIASDDTLMTDYPDASFVPGHGEVGKAKDVLAFSNYLRALRQAIKVANQQGVPDAAMVPAVLPQLKQYYGDWDAFDYFVQHNIEQTVAEFNGSKPVPAPAD